MAGLDGRRWAALVVAATAWAADILFVIEQMGRGDNVLQAIWHNLSFFTDIGTLICAIVFTAIAAGARISVRTLALAVLAGWLILAVYWSIGQGWKAFGRQGLADMLTHGFVPLLSTAFWLVFAPRPGLKLGHIPFWLLFPLGYVAYALTRGAISGRYPYDWMDVTKLGYPPVLTMVAILTGVFCVLCLMLIGLDRVIPGRRAGPEAVPPPP